MRCRMMTQAEDDISDVWSHSHVRAILDERLNLDELLLLCYDLGIDFDNLSGDGKSAKIASLLKRLEQRGAWHSLFEWLTRYRSDIMNTLQLNSTTSMVSYIHLTEVDQRWLSQPRQPPYAWARRMVLLILLAGLLILMLLELWVVPRMMGNL